MTPSGIASSTAISVDMIASWSESAKRRRISSRMGAPVHMDLPKSSRTMPAIWKQFLTWIAGIVRLDFGKSMWTGAPILEEIRLRFALSLQLAIMSTLIAVLPAIPLGVLASLKQDTWVDYLVRIVSIAGLATPSFWLGIGFIL